MRAKKAKQRETIIIEVTSWTLVLSIVYLLAKTIS
jgi:hypothetical protein